MDNNRTAIINSDDLDIVSAIWILSCNDENPIITYEGIKYRLNLPEEFDLKGLVKSRGELFREKVPERRLKGWKKLMMQGNHQPSWIKDIQDDDGRKKKIESITTEDVFRNQFRWQNNAPAAPIEIIEWGLQHIDRLRKANIESKEKRLKKISNIWIPLISMVVALFAIVSSAYMQGKSLDQQTDLKKYEVSFIPKHQNYSFFMSSLIRAWDSAGNNDHAGLIASLDKIETAYYSLEPFLSAGVRESIWSNFLQFSGLCYKLREETAIGGKDYEKKRSGLHNTFNWYKKYFRKNLYEELFQ